MIAHTPGPWRVADDGIVMAREVDGPVQAWGSVAQAIGTMEPGAKRANAAAIARLPTLVAALRSIHAVAMRSRDSAYNHGPVLKDFLVQIRDLAANALDPAEAQS